ncbi:MAG TPA: AMP-binding protein [Acidimicrobiales bacterium]|nr:AMP-binding protein [Acidimicrobiales bacterium]
MAERAPDQECIRFEDGTQWTWEEAIHQGYRAASVLADAGLERGNTMLLFLPNCAEWIRAWWGAAFLGAAIVPVNTANKGAFLGHVCEDSRAEIIVTDQNLATRLTEVEVDLRVIDAGSLALGDEREPALSRPIEPWETEFINYTSGTTGPSKGVVTSYLHAAMSAYDAWAKWTRPDDCMIVDLPLFHMGGQAPAFGHWSVGARIALRSVFSATRYLDICREVGATCGFMVGTMSNMLLAQPERDDDADTPLRRMLVAPMVPDPDGFRRRYGIDELFLCYGPTETGALTITEDVEADTHTLGHARDGVEVRVVDEHDVPVAPGTVGELIARPDRPWEFMTEYWGRPEATAEVWRNGWYHTGDGVIYTKEGNYYFSDRLKDSLRRRGENISSFEVEQAVLAFPAVLEAACVASPGEFSGDDEVKIFVVVRDGHALDPGELIGFLVERMPYFAIPRFVEIIDDMPKTPTNKIQKYELRERGNSPATWDRETAGIRVHRSM